MDPDTIRSLRSWVGMDLLPYCEGVSMITVDLSANCEGWIYDPNGTGIQIIEIRSRDPFSGSTDMSGPVTNDCGKRDSAIVYFWSSH